MKKALWFVLGVAGGFVAAHAVNKDPRGHELLAEVDSRITEFTDRIGDAYRAQEARIEGIAADVKDATSDALGPIGQAAAQAVGAAEATASEAIEAVKDAVDATDVPDDDAKPSA